MDTQWCPTNLQVKVNDGASEQPPVLYVIISKNKYQSTAHVLTKVLPVQQAVCSAQDPPIGRTLQPNPSPLVTSLQQFMLPSLHWPAPADCRVKSSVIMHIRD